MHYGSKIFVLVIFALLSLSFWATTITLYVEFSAVQAADPAGQQLWLKLLTHYSDLFIFFPVFGTVALVAFYTPACAFVDMYWNIEREGSDAIPRSRLRFAVWFIVLVLLSYFISLQTQQGSERSLWQLKPSVLLADDGEDCNGNVCRRVSFLDGIENVRKTSLSKFILTDLSRQCEPDPFVEVLPRNMPPIRYCLATTTFRAGQEKEDLQGKLIDNKTCCRAQTIFDKAVKQTHENPETHSITHQLQKHTWPFNIFFLLILMIISILLAFRRPRIEKRYADIVRSIDRGVIVGVFAVAFLTVMNRSFLEATQLLHGGGGTVSFHRGLDTFILLFTIWALLILFSFVHPANKQAEMVSRLLGVIFSVLFVFNAETVTNYGIRFLGAGAGVLELAGIGVIALFMIAALIILRHLKFMDASEEETTEAAVQK